MATSDWKSPFLRFRDQIRPLFDADVNVYHGVVMAPFHRRSMVGAAVRKLKAAKAGKVGIAAIETPTRECGHHAHYFYGDKGAYVALGQALSGVEDWIQSVPKGLLPKFSIPRKTTGIKKDLVTWACLVYHLAWELDLTYLRAVCEFRPLLAEGAFEPWSKWPHQPEGTDLRPLLIHKGPTAGDLEPLKMKFLECERFCYFPDVIDAYLVGGKSTAEFIGASLAAVDALVFMLDQVEDLKSVKSRELKKSTKSAKKNTKKAKLVIDATTLLGAFLHHYHFAPNSGAKVNVPLTVTQIAAAMNCSQPTASRRMKKLLGPNCMAKYRRAFQGKILPWLKDLVQERSEVIDAVVKSENAKDDFSKNDLD